MVEAVEFAAGGYRYVPGVTQYSGGAAALPGHEIVRVRFRQPLPLDAGFKRIETIIGEAGRPLTAFCACELRSPAPFSEAGFKSFNAAYCGVLERWGIYQGGVNPVARSNVCPEIAPPDAPCFHAFCFTVEAESAAPSFVIAGSGEVAGGGFSGQCRRFSKGFLRGFPVALGQRQKAFLELRESAALSHFLCRLRRQTP